MTFRRILVAIDRTPKAEQVFEKGLEVAIRYDAFLSIVYCVAGATTTAVAAPVPPAGVGYPWPSAILPTASAPTITAADPRLDPVNNVFEQQSQVAREWLQQYEQRAYDAGCKNVAINVRAGNPGDRICELAEELEVDLIVVGHRDRSGIAEFFLGSVSNKVAHNAPCAVLITQL